MCNGLKIQRPEKMYIDVQVFVFYFFVHLSFFAFSVIATSFLMNKGEYIFVVVYITD